MSEKKEGLGSFQEPDLSEDKAYQILYNKWPSLKGDEEVGGHTIWQNIQNESSIDDREIIRALIKTGHGHEVLKREPRKKFPITTDELVELFMEQGKGYEFIPQFGFDDNLKDYKGDKIVLAKRLLDMFPDDCLRYWDEKQFKEFGLEYPKQG